MSSPTPVDSSAVFSHTLRVGWADCDPALRAFTGRIPYFALEAIDEWWSTHLGVNWFSMNLDRNIGAPFVHMSIDFKSAVTPRHALVCEVRLIRMGNTSVRFSVLGKQAGVVCFSGEFVEVLVESRGHDKPSMPDDFREILQQLVTS